MTDWTLEGDRQQLAFGAALAEAVGERALIFLEGDLGAGKTTLVRGFLQQRGHRGKVKSPTYTLIEPYELPSGNVYHLDLYRLGDPEELEYLGLREMLQEQSVMLVEWAERGEGWLPAPDLVIELLYHAGGTARRARIRPFSDEGEKIVSRVSGR